MSLHLTLTECADAHWFGSVMCVDCGWGFVVVEQVPWLQTPTIFDIRTRPRSISSITGTKDLQMVNITLRVLSKPNVDKLPEIYKVLALATSHLASS